MVSASRNFANANASVNFGKRSGEICELGRRGERKILAEDAAITAVSLL